MPRKIADIRREEIVDALRGVVAREGLSVPSYDLIASEGGMSRQLVRHYYRNGEEMAADLASRLTNDLRDEIESALGNASPEQRLPVVLDTLFAWNKADVGGTDDRNALECALHAIGRRSTVVRDAFAAHLDAIRSVVAAELDGGSQPVEEIADAVTSLVVARNLPGANAQGLRQMADRLVGLPESRG